MLTVVSFRHPSTPLDHVEVLRRSAAGVGLPCQIDEGEWPGLPEFLLRKLDECPEDILWVECGGMIQQKPVRLLVAEDKPDMAAFVYVPSGGIVDELPGPFKGVGYIRLKTLFFRQNNEAREVLERWAAANADRPDRKPQENLLYFLAEERELKFLYLRPEYAWEEEVCRPFCPDARPVIWHVPQQVLASLSPLPAALVGPEVQKRKQPEVLWSGHFYDYSGYGKANRELLFRVANSVRVRLSQGGVIAEPVLVDGYTRNRLDLFKRMAVTSKAPLLRFYGPMKEPREERRRIIFTMMETETAHPELIRDINDNYDEVWVPTRWNARVFQAGGLTIPCHPTPLGVNPVVFRPIADVPRPAALRIAGGPITYEPPRGFTFVTVFQPTFRKGIDFMVRAFKAAFEGDPDVSLVLVTSVHRTLASYGCDPFADVGGPEKAGVNVYHLTGRFTDEEMAYLYNAFDAYITTSRGEGWNLPAAEAAACGLPVIASRCSSHREALGRYGTCLFDVDGFAPWKGSGDICRWYDGQLFADLGSRALDGAVIALRCVRLGKKIMPHGVHSWDASARIISRRLVEMQP